MQRPPEIPGYSNLTLLCTTSRYTLWSATQDALQRPVLIQAINPAVYTPRRLGLIFSAARQIAAIKSSHIPQVLDVIVGERPALVLEISKGHSLADRLGTGDNLPDFSQVAPVIAGLIEEFVVLSAKTSLVLRSLDADVIWLADNGCSMAWDFTMALEAAQTLGEEEIEGHLGYIPPELLTNQPFDTRSDMYSLGALIFRMLVGADAYCGGSPDSIIQRQLTKSPPPPSRFNPSLSPEVDTFVLKLMARTPDDRFKDWGEVMATFETLRCEPPAPVDPAAKPASARPPTHRIPGKKPRTIASTAPQPAAFPPYGIRTVAWLVLGIGLALLAAYRWNQTPETVPATKRTIAIAKVDHSPASPPAKQVQRKQTTAVDEPNIPSITKREAVARFAKALDAENPIAALNDLIAADSDACTLLKIPSSTRCPTLNELFAQALTKRIGQTIPLAYKGRNRTVTIQGVSDGKLHMECNGKSGAIPIGSDGIEDLERIRLIGVPQRLGDALTIFAYSRKLGHTAAAQALQAVHPELKPFSDTQ
ncbi:MAG: serine/threonine protein kinase [Kiritimatiellia bacterium]